MILYRLNWLSTTVDVKHKYSFDTYSEAQQNSYRDTFSCLNFETLKRNFLSILERWHIFNIWPTMQAILLH